MSGCDQPSLARIKYECSLAEILYAHNYNESNLVAPDIRMFSRHDLNNDVMQKLWQMQELCTTCGVTPADELNQQTLAVLRTFGFREEEEVDGVFRHAKGAERSRLAVSD